jgi:hypothetical protein
MKSREASMCGGKNLISSPLPHREKYAWGDPAVDKMRKNLRISPTLKWGDLFPPSYPPSRSSLSRGSFSKGYLPMFKRVKKLLFPCRL